MGQNPSRRKHAARIDHIDLNILTALSSRARTSKVEMSTQVGISASRCSERMRRLEQSGIVRGYHADIDIARLASSLQFLVQIKLLHDSAACASQFEKTVAKMPEILSCQSVLGHVDYIIVVVATSIESYQKVIAELRAQTADEFEFVTFPVSKVVKSPGQSDLRQILSRLKRDETSFA